MTRCMFEFIPIDSRVRRVRKEHEGPSATPEVLLRARDANAVRKGPQTSKIEAVKALRHADRRVAPAK